MDREAQAIGHHVEVREDAGRAKQHIAVAGYDLDLTETVPYIGGTVVHAAGYTGVGVRVAVLDSGIDYYHANLGGSGDPAEYAADDPNIIEPGTFPTAKVVGGFDFVGPDWPNSDLAPDPADVGRGAAGQPGLALSGLAPARGAGVGIVRVGRVGPKSPGEV